MRTFPSLPGLRGSLRRRASDLAASGLAPSRSPSSAYVRLSMLIGSPIVVVGSDRLRDAALLCNEGSFD